MPSRLAIALAFTLPAAAQLPDLIFERGNANAFQTLQAALDAAQPGQRIIMNSDAQAPNGPLGLITKSVTIEGAFSGPEFNVQAANANGLRIISVTPGVPLVFRNLQFSMNYGGGTISAIEDSHIPLAYPNDVIVMEDVSIGSAASSVVDRQNGWLTHIESHFLILRRCRFIAPDTANQPGCYIGIRPAIEALFFRGLGGRLSLYIEDSYLRGGSAGMINYPYGMTCTAYPVADSGGAAIRAPNVTIACVVRSTISDGNGGSVSPGPWPSPPVPGLAAHSLGNPYLLTMGYQFVHEHGRDDAGGPGLSRGNLSHVGNPDAPLSVGDALIGTNVMVSVAPSQLSPVAIALGTSLELSYYGPLGALALPLYPTPPIIAFPSIGTRSLPIPNRADLIGQRLVVQLIALYNGSPFISNPSISHFR